MLVMDADKMADNFNNVKSSILDTPMTLAYTPNI